jgi:hypothetical protein
MTPPNEADACLILDDRLPVLQGLEVFRAVWRRAIAGPPSSSRAIRIPTFGPRPSNAGLEEV